MTFDLAAKLFEQIMRTRLTSFRDEFIRMAVCYSRIRVDHLMADAEKQRRIGHDRSAVHNAFIAACNALAEAMVEQGEDASWRVLLGQERKVIGDLACYVHCILSLSAR